MREYKNIQNYYKKGYISQKALWCCLKLTQIYNYSGIPSGGSFDGLKVDRFRNFNEDIITYSVKNMLDYDWVIETLKLQITLSPDVKPKHLYLFLDFLFNDLTTRDLKKKYKTRDDIIKIAVIGISEYLVDLMKERKILK